MSERLRELLEGLRDHWDDHYWWANHLELRVLLLSLISGLVGLLFAWLEVQIRKAGATA